VQITYNGLDEIEVPHDDAWYVFAPGATVDVPDELAKGRPAVTETVDGIEYVTQCGLAGLLARPDFTAATATDPKE